MIMFHVREQGRSFVGLSNRGGCGLGGRRRLVAPCESAVVEALTEEDDVGNGIVYSKDDLEAPSQPLSASAGACAVPW